MRTHLLVLGLIFTLLLPAVSARIACNNYSSGRYSDIYVGVLYPNYAWGNASQRAYLAAWTLIVTICEDYKCGNVTLIMSPIIRYFVPTWEFSGLAERMIGFGLTVYIPYYSTKFDSSASIAETRDAICIY
jgi:hypothetical protein